MGNNTIKSINYEDLKYSEAKYKELMEARKKQLDDAKPKRLGSTSTLSTVSSLNYSNLSTTSFKLDHQSFKTVNTTFDSMVKMEKLTEKQTLNTKTFTLTKSNSIKEKNATFNIKDLNHTSVKPYVNQQASKEHKVE